MKEHHFYDELTYQLTMIQADQLLSDGLITDQLYQAFKANMLRKYQPFISQLVG